VAGRDFVDRTRDYWMEWVRRLSISYDWQEAIIRAAITLKLSNFDETGGIIAAHTTSIPEAPSSGRTWDYRYCWLRDAYFVVQALNRIGAHMQLVRRDLTLEIVQELLQDLLRASERRVTIDEIQRRVAEHFNIKMAEMTSSRRARVVARPRQVAMYLAKQLTQRSLPEIGRKFGGRDHTTVMHAVKKVEELTRSDRAFAEDVELLHRMLGN